MDNHQVTTAVTAIMADTKITADIKTTADTEITADTTTTAAMADTAVTLMKDIKVNRPSIMRYCIIITPISKH